ncbi:uncharacterized protein LOC129589070 isoform X2 [Paramacrobiotus metropolitanus]|uniref:uncharacterized protein LOC129589070 isoform X2 n=1 Tax=Paramacrobiotus metropolitanus TaxID=2943436 RepID=UPI0024462056|nr:uncharacterized protein LOC129589070 isoform X2 [Paramacrobiotus metropolitanus]XP_055339537.1 uncharacterized protein LOC129589070 isoform X2 [Paramacrobiotus metropolitanus]XP_055339538.1 uncharacterized protein LOC129589070 isoform X2 [Paramacrobiotus metropolitanus]
MVDNLIKWKRKSVARKSPKPRRGNYRWIQARDSVKMSATETVIRESNELSNEIDTSSEADATSSMEQKIPPDAGSSSVATGTYKNGTVVRNAPDSNTEDSQDPSFNTISSTSPDKDNGVPPGQDEVKVHKPGTILKTGLYTKAYHSEYSDY